MPTDPRDNPLLDEAFGEPGGQAAAQVEALTEAIGNLTSKIADAQSAGAVTGGPAVPWWFKFTLGKPGPPGFAPPGSVAERESGGMTGVMAAGGGPPRPPWWSRYMEMPDDPDDERFSFIRSHWRRRGRRPETKAEPLRDNPLLDEAFDPRAVEEPEGAAEAEGPAASARNRRRKDRPWHWKTTRKVAGLARLRFGRKTGQAVTAGMSIAARRLMWGGSARSAARAGLMAGVTAGGPAAVGVALLAGAAVKAAESLNKLTAEQLTYNRHLASASAQMAMVFAQRDVQERMREREVGDRLAASAGRLTQAEQFKEDNTKEIGIAWNRLKNDVGTAWELFKGSLFFQLNLELGVLNRIMEFFEGTDQREKNLTMGEWVKKIADEDREARKRDRKWEDARQR